MLKSFHKLLVFLSIILFIEGCEKDPFRGWDLFIESPPPPKIKELYYVVKNCVPPYPVTYYQNTENLIGNVTYTWYFGDGTTSNELNPTHIYQQTGTYKVKLVVRNEIGSDSATIDVPELNLASIPIVSNFTYRHFNNNNFAPTKVIFTNKSTGSNIFSWDFGDGQQDNDDEPTHIFQNQGTYTVKLRSYCTDGSYSDYQQQIFVNPKPQRVFIDAINLMLPKNYNGQSIYIEMYHNTTYIGKTRIKSGSYPIKFNRPSDFVDGYFFDYVQFTSNEVFKFVILRDNGSNSQPTFINEITLASVDIKNNFYPSVYYTVRPIPPVEDVFIDLYLSY
ncbi:MAG: PKD domain-containing protein [Bacteroidales bacterium]|nr:PKD domain-containing protein [Bacteroidales bacterium]